MAFWHKPVRASGADHDFTPERHVNGGTGFVAGGVAASSTFPHGLGLAPVALIAVPHQNQHMASVPTWDSVNMTVTLRRPDGGSVSSGFSWWAYG
jgi:hypothetical protein